MLKTHSTVSRRDFMKALGLAGAGLGAAAAATPVFHDLDEAMSSPQAIYNRSWYVKAREFGELSIEIDWDVMKRRDLRGFSNWNLPIMSQHYPGGPGAFYPHLEVNSEKAGAKFKEIWPDAKDPTTRDYALKSAFGSVGLRSPYELNTEMGGVAVNPISRPEEIGMPVWQGTPEENLMMVRAAFSVLGLGPPIGVAELNENTKNFVWEYSPAGHNWGGSEQIIFDDSITEYYQTEDPPTLHIPSSHRYVIATHNMSCDEILRRPFSTIGASTETLSYSRVSMAKSFFEQFIRGLGYHVVYGHRFQSAPAFDLASGVGEHCRMGQITGSPEYGGLMRTHAVFSLTCL